MDDDARARAFDAMTADELAAVWCRLQLVGMKGETEESRAAQDYFDRLPDRAPARTFDLVLAVLRTEAATPVLMQLNDRLFRRLLQTHGAAWRDRIAAEVEANPRLRWLVAGSGWWLDGAHMSLLIAGEEARKAYYADYNAQKNATPPLALTAMTVTERARAWIEQKSKPPAAQDENWMRVYDFTDDLVSNDPDAALDLILEVLRIETDERLLGLLAAGMLECVIGTRTIDRIEREAAVNPRFVWLLGGVYYWNEPEPLKARLDAILQGRHWEN
jgi:hypothetical protein